MTSEPSKRLAEKRNAVKAALRTAFRNANQAELDAIMAAFYDLREAERVLDKQEWVNERYRDQAHDAAVRRAREAAAENRKAARAIRADAGIRTCSKCGRAAGEKNTDGKPTTFYPDQKSGKPRLQCRQCERAQGKEYRARKEAARLAAEGNVIAMPARRAG